jgi:hypothetical protein
MSNATPKTNVSASPYGMTPNPNRMVYQAQAPTPLEAPKLLPNNPSLPLATNPTPAVVSPNSMPSGGRVGGAGTMAPEDRYKDMRGLTPQEQYNNYGFLGEYL